MGVLLQAAYRRAPGVSVPSPADGDPSVPWWWDHLAAQANSFRLSGFTAVLLPPVLKTSAGAAPGADGYGTFDDYDLGSKNQKLSTRTRFGSREQLQRCVALMRANGLDVYIDMVPHQRDGGSDYVYRYVGADGTPDVGRFPKDADCFYPNVPRDPIAGPVGDDFPFGDELAPVNALPKGYVMHGLIEAGDWLTRTLDAQGYRVDDVKGLAVEFVRMWLTSQAMAGSFAVGEYFDGNAQTLNWWVWQSGMMGRCNAFDFSLRFLLAAMCNNNSHWDMSQLDHAGLTGISPANAVTFVENPDTDLSFPVAWNKLLGYAYILTSEGYPCVFYKDYSTDAGCYGLRPAIDNLIWIHENLAAGTTVTRFKDYQAIVYERQGFPNLLVGLNNDQYHGWRTLTVPTGFGPGVQLHDYTGHAGDVWTDGAGMVTIGVPPNRDGTGYVAYSRNGLGRPAFPVLPRRVTQLFAGAPDLDIGPVRDGGALEVGRVWCAQRTPIGVKLHPGLARWNPATEIVVDILAPGGAVLASQQWTGSSPPPATLRARTQAEGWHGFRLSARALPPPGHMSFELMVTYGAPETLSTAP
jgi:alpha-amylase